MLLVLAAVEAGRSNGKKRILIHVPLQVKEHHHTHTVYKHIVHEHDHEHQHHGESPPSGGGGGGDGDSDSTEGEEANSAEYSASGSNADYKVLGYTYGDDAEPVLRLSSSHNGGDSDNEEDGRTLRGYDEWAPSKPARARRPSQQQKGTSSQRYRDHQRYRGNGASDDDVVVVRTHSGRGSSTKGNGGGASTRPRPLSNNSHKGYRPTAGKTSGGRYNHHHHSQPHEFAGEYDNGSVEDESSDEIWTEDGKYD